VLDEEEEEINEENKMDAEVKFRKIKTDNFNDYLPEQGPDEKKH